MVQVLFAEGRVRLRQLEGRVRGVDAVERLARPFTPEAVAAPCRIPAETIRRLARELSDAPRGAVYGRIGTCNQEFGTLASWLVEVLNVLTGNLDRPGGAMFSNSIAWSTARRRSLSSVRRFRAWRPSRTAGGGWRWRSSKRKRCGRCVRGC